MRLSLCSALAYASLKQRAQLTRPLVRLPRPPAPQASVALGEPGVSLTSPEVPRLELLASMFNSFGGRLFDQASTAWRAGAGDCTLCASSARQRQRQRCIQLPACPP